ncbi:MAG TPA: SEC-C metal-binding domain-containing protein [Opitutales bacterium]|nr:SEC-C metal-binding domain-containing protein [Opitutales bacterium]
MARKKKRPQRRKGPNRNALCPCGSGRAYKNCCAKKRQSTPDKPDSVQNQLKRIAYGLLLLVLIIAAVVLARTRPWEAKPEPFEFDAQQNRYWDPDHGHWHEGTPPSNARSAVPPQPWEYDAANDQHWDPNHGHWHQGRPPPKGQR